MRKRTRIAETDSDQVLFMDLSFEDEENENNIEVEIAVQRDNLDSSTGDDFVTVTTTDSPDDIENTTKKRNKFTWKIHSEWDDLDEALEFLEEQGFVCHDFKDLKCGLKFYHRCKLVPKLRKRWCIKKYILYLPSNSLKIQILCIQCDHDHDEILKDEIRPPSEEMEELMFDLFKCGTTKTDDVIRHIELARDKHGLFKKEENPRNRQITYLLKKIYKAAGSTNGEIRRHD